MEQVVSDASAVFFTFLTVAINIALAMLFPTSVVLVGGLAIAKVGHDRFLRFVWPLWLAMLIASTVILGVAASVV